MVEPASLAEPVPPLDLMPTTLEDAVRAAVEKNPNLAASERTVDVNGLQRDIAAADYYPKVDVVGRGNREDNVDGVEGLRKDWSVLLEARWELYSGFRTQSRVSRATIAHAASKDDHADVNRQVVEEVRLAWDAVKTTEERVELLNNAVTIAAEVFDARDKLRRAGKESTLNVLDAEREVYDARINLVDAKYDALTSVFRVLLALGRLSPDHLGITAQ
jgi:adhesin transport system outer membrane protein